MGSYGCHCGSGVHMGHDYVPHKAHLIADQDMEDFIETARSDAIRAYAFLKAEVYQCPSCSRLIIIPRNGQGSQQTFAPDEVPTGPLLRSVKGKNWRRPLRADWSDKEGKGNVWWGDTGVREGEDNGFVFLNTWQEVKALYDQVFERLLSAKELRSAKLRRNDTTEHEWWLQKQ